MRKSRCLFTSFDFKIQHTTDHRRAEYLWEHIFGTDTLAIRRLGFDSAGRVTAYEPSTTRYHGYEYDGRSQLVRRETWDEGGWCTFSLTFGVQCGAATLVEADTFTYDLVGNRTDHGAQIDPGNRLTRIAVHGDTMVYEYDAVGNVIRREKRISGEVQDLYWNALGQLDSVVIGGTASPDTVRFRYDALGRRVGKEEGGSTIDYVWADGHVLFDIQDGTVTEYSYLPGTDRPHSLRRNGFFYYYLTDHLGSVIGVDSQAVVKNAYEYDAWGWTESESEQVENRFRFSGRECDLATDLYYLRARYYDPATGRFLSEDPLGLAAGLNPYSYAGNSPVTARDPSGLDLVYDGDECVEAWRVRTCIGDDCGPWTYHCTRWRSRWRYTLEDGSAWLGGGAGGAGTASWGTGSQQESPVDYEPLESCPADPVTAAVLGDQGELEFHLAVNQDKAERGGSVRFGSPIVMNGTAFILWNRMTNATASGGDIPADARAVAHYHVHPGLAPGSRQPPSPSDTVLVNRLRKALYTIARDSLFVSYPNPGGPVRTVGCAR